MQGLRGLVAQGMNGRKGTLPPSPIPQMLDVVTPGSGTFTALSSGILSIYLQGGGATGRASNGAGSIGGGGGGASFKRIRLSQGQSLAWVCGAGGAAINAGVTGQNAGADSTVTVPNGQVVRAGGADNAGNPGTGSGGDVNSRGGAGGTSGNTGGAGDNGGAPGTAGTVNGGGGGGVAGLTSVTSGFPIDFTALFSAPVGQGSNGNDSNGGTAGGGAGRVLMILQRYAARP